MTLPLLTAQLRHLPWLLRVLWRFEHGRGRSRLTDAWLMWKVVRNGEVRISRDAQGPIGYLIRRGNVILGLYIDPRGQGQGHGRRLMDEAMALHSKLELWALQENTRAIGFYQATGFAEMARGRGLGNDAGLPDIHLAWQRKGTP